MHYALYKDAQGQYRWALKADNGKTIADSGEGYHNKGDCEAGIRLVQSSASAKIVEEAKG